jgi:transcriptional regulator with XRE-family HTH domain
MATPYSAAQEARAALANRLREIGNRAGLSGRELASLAEWHESKVSKIEHAKQPPSVADIQAWCLHCGAGERVAEELMAALHAAEGMWVEWQRMERGGLRRAQESVAPIYERTRRFRFYCSSILPGIVQTEVHTGTMLRAIMRRRHVPDDIEDAVAVRMKRTRYLRGGDRRYSILVEESALRCGIGSADLWAGQLGHLLSVSTYPSVSLGVIPFGVGRDVAWPVESFYMFDDAEVNVELVAGYLSVTEPRGIAMYAQVFSELHALAVFGARARRLISYALDAASGEIEQA